MADTDVALRVAAIEAAVVDAYRDALEQQSVPADLADTVLVLAQHHDEHCAALAAVANTTRASVGRDEVLFTAIVEDLRTVDPRPVLHAIESSLAGAHLSALGDLRSPAAAAVVASVLPVEARHAVALDPSDLPTVQSTVGAYG